MATPCMAGPRRDGYGVRHRLLSQAPAGFPALNGLAARAKKLPALRSGQTVFASMKRGVASDAGPQDRPPRATVLYSHRDPAMHGVAGRPSGATGEERCWGEAVECRGDARCCDGQEASGPTRGSPSMVMRSCAWAGCGANKAQALAAGDSATQHGFSRATVSCSRKLFDRSEAQGVFSRGSRGLPTQGIRLEVRKHRSRTP